VDDSARIDQAFSRVLARSPNPEEMQTLQSSISRLKSEFAGDPDAAKQLLSNGESPSNEKNAELEASELAAYTSLCLAILNLDETLTRE
jgi:hypothetical protein